MDALYNSNDLSYKKAKMKVLVTLPKNRANPLILYHLKLFQNRKAEKVGIGGGLRLGDSIFNAKIIHISKKHYRNLFKREQKPSLKLLSSIQTN